MCDGVEALCLSAETRVQFDTALDALATADLDGDGNLDLVGVATSSGALAVLWGGGTGVVEVSTTWSVGPAAGGVVIADLDGDGRLDLATALPTDDAVAVLRGRGGRSFTPPELHPAGSAPHSLLAADLDGVEPPELITADLGGGTVTVLRELVASSPVVVGPGPRGLAAGDLDGDGDIDLAVALADDGAVQVLVGDGAGGLLPGPKHRVGAAPHSIVAADLDDDGALDLATADVLDDTISVLLSDGAGGHRPARAFPTLPQPGSLVAVRDETSRPVLAIASGLAPKVERLDPRDGQTRSTAISSGWWSVPAIAAGDGGRIVYVVHGQTGAVSPGDGLRATPLWRAPEIAGITPIDLEGDGIDEFVVKTSSSGDALALWRGGPDPREELGVSLSGPGVVALAGDLTGDGRRDVVAWTSEELVVLNHQTDGSLLPVGPPTKLPPGIRTVALGDRDGDGRAEIFLARSEPEGTELLWWTADAGAPAPAEQRFVPQEIREAYLVDGDGDANVDLILQTEDALLLYEDSGDLTRAIDLGEWSDHREFAFADVDGDGALDMVACSFRGLAVRSAILVPESAVTSRLHDRSCDDVTLVDLDGDGQLDLLAESSVIDFALLAPWLQRSGEWREFGRELVPRAPGTAVSFARLDGDDVPEVVMFDPEAGDGVEALRLTLGPSLVDSPGGEMRRLDSHHLGDLDGDGAADILAAGDGIAVAFADRRGGFGPLIRRAVADVFGADAALAGSVVADFDGDGVDEWIVGVRQPSLRQWVLHRVHVGRGGELSHESVAPLPIDGGELHAADLDGDGALDLVAFAAPRSLDSFLLRGDGRGHFAAPQESAIPGSEGLQQTRLFDVDRDGRLDVVALFGGAPAMFLSTGLGGGAFAAPRVLSRVPADAYAAGDFDRDGGTDLAVAHPLTGDLLLVRGGASETPRLLLELIGAVDALDLDRDGHPELVAAGSDVLYVSRPRDDGRLAFVRQTVVTGGVRRIRAGDIDGDGALDLALFGESEAAIVRHTP